MQPARRLPADRHQSLRETQTNVENRQWDGPLTGAGKRIGIVAARFNGRIVERLVEGAVDCLARHGVPQDAIEVARVPGAWEIPHALQELAVSGRFDALVALGLVLRGETAHFEYVAGECSRGCAEVALRHRVPVGFGVLTCADPAHAEERASGKLGNKGWDAALAALEMATLTARLRQAAAKANP
jgi:6,7-dimethyl-8-ribityllumazine synthase